MKKKHFTLLLFLYLAWMTSFKITAEQSVTSLKKDSLLSESVSLYPTVNEKSWLELIAENNLNWRSPYTANLLIQPVHSPDWIFVNPSMVVSRRRVTENVSTTDALSVQAALSQEDLVVHFAFDNPAFVPDFRLCQLKLADNRYPVVSANYFANDIYYEIEYMVSPIDEKQNILCAEIKVRNDSNHERDVNVRTKIGYYPEDKTFAYHYIPFNWNAGNWKPYYEIQMKNDAIYKKNNEIGRISSGTMIVEWEASKDFTNKQYEEILYPQVWYGSGYALPEFRLQHIQDVVLAHKKLKPLESAGFSIKLLTDDVHITSKHLEILDMATPSELRYQAITNFQKQFSDNRLKINFQEEYWDDILTELQICILQLLVKQSENEFLQPTQGGSSERFYVWVFEAVQMLRPMLRTGHFDVIKRAIDYIFSLQDAGFPPVGRFTTTKGSIGTTGPRWANTTGMGLALACDYYLYTNDDQFLQQYLSKILNAVNWIAGEVKATQKLNTDGTRPLTYGLMPFAVASDGDEGFFVSATDIFSFYGFEKAVHLFEKINHPEAGRLRSELELYRTNFLTTIKHLTRPDGYIERKIASNDKDIVEATKFENTDIMAPIATIGIMSPEDIVFQKYIQYYEENVADNYFMGKMDRDIFYVIQCEHYWQPIYLMLKEWKKAFMTTRICLKYAMSQDTYQTQERFDKRNPAFNPWQPNGSGSGRMIDMMLNSFYFEKNNQSVVLLGAIPFIWLTKNKETIIKNLYTLTGEIKIEIFSIGPHSCTLKLSSNNPLPQEIIIPAHLHPEVISDKVEKVSEDSFILINGLKEVKFQLSE